MNDPITYSTLSEEFRRSLNGYHPIRQDFYKALNTFLKESDARLKKAVDGEDSELMKQSLWEANKRNHDLAKRTVEARMKLAIRASDSIIQEDWLTPEEAHFNAKLTKLMGDFLKGVMKQ